MKFIVRIIFLLLLVNGSLLYLHYNDAGKAIEKGDVQQSYSQEIEVVNRANGLYIRHHFTGLSDSRFEIVWPKTSTKRSCYLNDGTECIRLNGDATAFVEGETDRQSIMYVIPKDQTVEQSTLFENVFAVLAQSHVASTMLHLTDETGIGGSWVTGLRQLGNKKMDLIDYSLYMDSGVLTDLYWHKDELSVLYSGDELSVLGPDVKLRTADFKEADAALGNLGAPHSTIVVSDNAKRVDTTRFIISERLEIDGITDVLLVNNIYEKYLISKEEPLIAEVVTSLLSNKIVGSEKSREIVETLYDNLSVKEIEQVIEVLSDNKGQEIDAAYLDHLIGDVMDIKTSFISKNNDVGAALYPFVLEDRRKVTLSGEEVSDISPIVRDGKLLYPVTKIMGELGYEVSSNKQSLYIKNSLRSFRFPLKEKFYVYNDRRYNVKSILLEKIDDEFYFDEAVFMRVFLVEIKKTTEAIDIVPIATFLEGDAVN